MAPLFIPRPAIDPGIAEIVMTNGMATRVPADLANVLGRHPWHPRKTRQGLYVFTRLESGNDYGLRGGDMSMQRIIMTLRQGDLGRQVVDHENHDLLDNTDGNLRVCTRRNNGRNRQKSGAATKSRYKGVRPAPGTEGRRWQARIRVDYRLLNLGCFGSEREAAEAYDMAALRHFGEFACLNLPGDAARPAMGA